MLSKDYRLSEGGEISLVKEKGKLFHSKNFSILVLDKPGQTSPRFGFIISTKISSKATIRNKIKRALHEGVRYILVFVNPEIDVLFLAKPGADRAYTDVLMQEVKSCFSESGLLKS